MNLGVGGWRDPLAHGYAFGGQALCENAAALT